VAYSPRRVNLRSKCSRCQRLSTVPEDTRASADLHSTARDRSAAGNGSVPLPELRQINLLCWSKRFRCINSDRAGTAGVGADHVFAAGDRTAAVNRQRTGARIPYGQAARIERAAGPLTVTVPELPVRAPIMTEASETVPWLEMESAPVPKKPTAK